MQGAGEGDCVIECRVFTGESSVPDDKNTPSSLTKASGDVFPLLHGTPPEGVESCGTSAASLAGTGPRACDSQGWGPRQGNKYARSSRCQKLPSAGGQIQKETHFCFCNSYRVAGCFKKPVPCIGFLF